MNKSKIAALICTVLFVVAMWFIWIYGGFRYSYSEDESFLFEEYEVDELISDVEAHQEFVAEERYLKGVAFYLINLPEDRSGFLNVELRDDSGKTISKISHEIEKWTVDEWEWFDFDTRLNPGRKYEFVLGLSDYTGRVIPFLIRIPNTNIETYTNCQTGEYEGNNQCVAMRFRYAIPASVYEKMAYTLILVALLFVFLAKVVSIEAPHWADKLVAGTSLLGVFILYVPNIAYKLKYINLDDSWRYFLNVANPREYIFGRDIIFTYGPLGYLCYMMNLPENKAFFWLGVAIWTLVITGFIYLLIKLLKANFEGRLSTYALVLSFVLAFASYKVIERDNFLL